LQDITDPLITKSGFTATPFFIHDHGTYFTALAPYHFLLR